MDNYSPLKVEKKEKPYTFAGDMERMQEEEAIPPKTFEVTMELPRHSDTYPDDNPKTKFGVVKPSTFHIPPTAMLRLGAAMLVGHKKYGHYNWRKKRVTASVYYDAMQRHMQKWQGGEDFCEETLPSGEIITVDHLAFAMACLAIIIDAGEVGNLNDDREPVAS